jgi:hypothetical protein
MARQRRVTKPEILIDSLLKQQIADELNTTSQTVRMALQYNNNSPLGRAIRKRAKELLEEEAGNIEDFE